MPRFLVKIRGSNFLLRMDDESTLQGFFTHRLVDAPDDVLAAQAALEEFKASTKCQGLMRKALNAERDPPKVHVEEISEVGEAAEFAAGTPPGLVFYDMKLLE